MGIRDKITGSKEYKEARQELDEVGRRGGPEVDSDEHVRRNDRVSDTEPAWRHDRRNRGSR